MIARFRMWSGSLTARDFALLVSAALIAAHGAMLALALTRLRSANSLRDQAQDLRADLDQITSVEEETLAELEGQLQASEAQMEEIMADMPVPEAPYPVYPRIYSRAREANLELLSVTLQDRNVRTTEVGELELQMHSVEALAEPRDCLRMVESLEADGGISLATNRIRIDRNTGTCSFQVVTARLNDSPSVEAREGVE